MMETKTRWSIMLVEDDPAHAELTLRSLEALAPERCEVEHVVDGQAALERLQSARPAVDLVLLDLRLPRMDGLELLARVQTDPALRQIPIVVLTTSNAEDERQRALAGGASSYLVKPFGEDELLAVTRMLGFPGLCTKRASCA